MRYLLIILKILTLTILFSAFSTAQARDRVFLLAGQSNMKGLGATYQLKHWQKRTPHNVVFYNNGSQRPVPLVRGGRFGPEVAFAHKLSRSFPRDRIILIKVAAGGTPITQWTPGTRNYRAIINQVRHSLRQNKQAKQVDAILWMQGESDASTPHRAHR
ncbi:MAG: sialate O-acetylesterase, partial [Thiolinea sp.]